jgi:uncharacterized protein involved in exopolysaccharide biosynthesis
MDLVELVGFVWEGKWYLLASLVVSLGLGIAYLNLADAIFNVSARLLVEPRGMALNPEGTTQQEKEFVATQAEIIGSPAVVARAARAIGGSVGDEAVSSSLDQAAASRVDLIIKNLSVKPLVGTNVLDLTYRSVDPNDGLRIVESIIVTYREYLREMGHGDHLEALRTLAQSERELREDLESLQADYRQLRKKSPLIGQAADTVHVERTVLEQLGQTLTETRSQRIALENRLAALINLRIDSHKREGQEEEYFSVSSSPPPRSADAQHVTPLPPSKPAGERATADIAPADMDGLFLLSGLPWQGLQDPAALQQELLRAEVREKELMQNYGARHPDLRAARGQIAAWRAQLQELADQGPITIRRELAAVQLQEQRLAELYQEEFEQVKSIDDHLLLEQHALERVQQIQSLHDAILTQLKGWQLADQAVREGRSGVKVTLLEEPNVPELAVWPNRSLVLGSCGAIGLIGGIGLIMACGRQRSSGRHRELS